MENKTLFSRLLRSLEKEFLKEKRGSEIGNTDICHENILNVFSMKRAKV
jgi:hypothetical protein